jgi:uncharacterized protein (TIGR01777 family)
MRILISGGSGLIGRKLTDVLLAAGHEPAWLGRKAPKSLPAHIRFFSWNPEKLEMAEEAVAWAEAVINLAGASIGETKWNSTGKKQILESRIFSVKTLSAAFSGKKPLKSFVGISGAGFYGKGTRAFREEDVSGGDFPAKVAAAWEKAYQELNESCHPEHFCLLRLGVVLSVEGGALPKILQPFQLGIGSELGDGKQPFNWIHEKDAVQIMKEALQWDGIFNASAPARDTNSSLTRVLGQVLGKSLIFPAVPGMALRILLGDRSSLVLEGNWSDVSGIRAKGFAFAFADLRDALEDLLSPSNALESKISK